MSNIQLPAQTDLPPLEPPVRHGRSNDTDRDERSFDDHLEQASQPNQEPISASQTQEQSSAPVSGDERSEAASTPDTSPSDAANDVDGEEQPEMTDATAESTADRANVETELSPHEVAAQSEKAHDAASVSQDATAPQDATAAAGKLPTVDEKPHASVSKDIAPSATGPTTTTETVATDVAKQLATGGESPEPVATAEEDGGEQSNPQTAKDVASSSVEAKNKISGIGADAADSTRSEQTQDPTNTQTDDEPQGEAEDDTPQRSKRPLHRAPSSADSATNSTEPTGKDLTSAATTASNGEVELNEQPNASDLEKAVAPVAVAEQNTELSGSSGGNPDIAESGPSSLSRAAARVAARSEPTPSGETTLNEPQRARFVQRVAGAFQSAAERDGTIRVRLSPPELGSLRLQVTVKEGALVAQLETETPEARRLILTNLPELRDRLALQDVKVERFDVDVRDDGRDPQAETSDRNESADHGNSERASHEPTGTTEDLEDDADIPTSDAASDSDQLNIVI